MKKTQETREVIREAAANNHNLRPRPQRPSSEVEIATPNEEIDDADNETTGDFLSDNEDMHSSTKKKRKGSRGATRMDDIVQKEPGSMPKIKIELIASKQPVGENYRKLSSCIGVLTRRMLPVGCSDWRLVHINEKMALWKDIKKRFDIDDAALEWVMASAGAKWKQYKAKLKRQIFDETLTDEQLKNLHGHRIDVHELDSLIKYWRSPESQALAARGKNNRAKLKFLHTSGSVSYASAAHKMGQQLGRPPRRDEVYIKTHTRKNGVPLMPAASTIADLQEVVKVYPELMDRTIQQGDIFAVVCGEKEPRGRVRCLGLGPTPQDIGTTGLKAYSSTKLQIQVLARQQAESENLVLQQRILEMQEREEQSMARESPNVETNSHNGSNSRKHMSPPYEKHAEANQHVQGEEDHDCVGDDYVENEELDDEANQQVPAAAASPVVNTATSPTNDVQRFARDDLVGNDVILFAMSSNEKVAKATVVSINPNNHLAGEALGTKFCEVIVNIVFKRDALVPRPYAEMKTLGDAVKMPVAWPFNRLKVCSQQPKRPSQGVAGSSQVVARFSQRSSQGAAGSSQGVAGSH